MMDTKVPSHEAPLLVVVADDADRITDLPLACRAAGWCVEIVDAEGLSKHRRSLPELVLVDCADERACVEALESIRSTFDAMVPIITLECSGEERWCADRREIDARLDRDLPPAALVDALGPWRPVSMEPTRRIAAMLGDGPIAGMIERLARRLEAALVDVEAGTIDKAEAHRLAGLCGTLGFGQAHAAWLDLSVGKTTSLADARRTTRLTLAAIARGL